MTGAQWLMEEIGRYLVGDQEAGARDDAAREALANGADGFRAFVDSRCCVADVVLTQVHLDRVNGHTCRHAFRVAPGPIAFLVFCAANCSAGDRVQLRQVTAGAGTTSAEEVWPFGLDVAERMTQPVPTRGRPDRTASSADDA
jgi:hypothetical protein